MFENSKITQNTEKMTKYRSPQYSRALITLEQILWVYQNDRYVWLCTSFGKNDKNSIPVGLPIAQALLFKFDNRPFIYQISAIW